MAVPLCRNCGSPVPPGAAYCGACGAPQVPAQVLSAYAYPPYPVMPSVRRKSRRALPLVLLGAVLLLCSLALTVVAALSIPAATQSRKCPPSCGRPPSSGPSVATTHTYTSSALGYSLRYSDGEPLIRVGKIYVQDQRSIGWSLGSGGWPVLFTGESANGRAPDQIVSQAQMDRFPNATLAYAMASPNGSYAELGYITGAGSVYDLTLTSGNGQSRRARLIVMAAVKGNIAVELIALGPYVATTPKDGHPNPAATPVAGLVDPIANTVTWPGDPEP